MNQNANMSSWAADVIRISGIRILTIGYSELALPQRRVRHISPEEIDASLCELSSYRPISNLSFLSTLLERVISVQMTEYLSSAGFCRSINRPTGNVIRPRPLF